MRFIFIFLSLIFSMAAQAVVTNKCPETLSVSVPVVQKFSRSFIDQSIEAQGYNNDFGESYNQAAIDYFLSDVSGDGFSFDFELEDKSNSNCYYSPQKLWDGLLGAAITGTDAEAKLVLSYDNGSEENFIDFVMFADPVSKNPIYAFAGSTLQIKATGQKNSYGDDYPTYIPVGKAEIPSEEQFKYQVTPEAWSIDLLLDTCKGELEAAIDGTLKELGGDPKDSAAILPEVIGYKYFNLKFQALDGNMVLPQDVIEYQFEYRTKDDQHTQCTDILPQDVVN